MTRATDMRGDKYIDSRDILRRFQDLDSDREAQEEDGTVADWDDTEEYADLKALISECEGYGDFRHGEQLIRDDCFEDYARELAEDIGAIDRNASWPLQCIDWERAAEELKGDYMSVDFGGYTYWIRA